ncbi:hypothetical protein [Salinisphaera orenii]|uniref:Transglutaminase-like domain-containing protein n=1 Tax=Salinisphaera orenii YIM 95161 TaxID=1051139 RepID=A0A423Q209_9GAMM|nr:hypothetical protein [Salinisphaera halophila]ROO32505.1 hypothetical protein SAHL_04920 [Salinisphaera halophila YIM 95161]
MPMTLRASAKRRRAIGYLAGSIGTVLIALSLLGDFTPLGQYSNDAPRSWESFDPEKVTRERSLAALRHDARTRLDDFESATSEAQMLALFETTTTRFSHSDGARYTIFSNWILAAAGLLNRNFSVIRDPERMVAGGHSLICSQSSYLLLTLARQEGIKVRHVGLDGHVVMEAWYDGAWHMFDPDQEVIARTEDGSIASVDDLAERSDLLESAYAQPNQRNLIPIIASQANNSFVSYPEGARFVWTADVLAHVERSTAVLKYVLPLLLVLVGFALLKGAAWPVSRQHHR